MSIQEIVNAINDNENITGCLYDFIAYNKYDMSKDDLTSLLLEIIYALDTCENRSKDTIKSELIKNLEERF